MVGYLLKHSGLIPISEKRPRLSYVCTKGAEQGEVAAVVSQRLTYSKVCRKRYEKTRQGETTNKLNGAN